MRGQSVGRPVCRSLLRSVVWVIAWLACQSTGYLVAGLSICRSVGWSVGRSVVPLVDSFFGLLGCLVG